MNIEDIQKTHPYYNYIDELFVDPFMEQLFSNYKEKNFENKVKVQTLIETIKGRKIHIDMVQLIAPNVVIDNTDEILNALAALFRVYHQGVELKNIFSKPLPDNYKRKNYLIKKFSHKIDEYYGESPKRAINNNKSEIKKLISKLMDLGIKYLEQHEKIHVISSYIRLLRIYLGKPINPNPKKVYNCLRDFSYCDLSGKDLRNKLITGVSFNNCKFIGTKFKGNGMTDTCIHIEAKNSDFTDADFQGKICNKTSCYNGSNFTRVNLTTLTLNLGGVTMKNCNFTDAYIIDKGKKLMGKNLLKYLDDRAEGSYYTSPDDGGYNKNELDSEIWSFD